MINIDPKIKILDALSAVNGNQAELGRKLGVKRACVNGWIAKNLIYLPPLHAYRFVVIFKVKKAA